MDTRDKRFSTINVGLPFGRVVPNPDGAIDTSAERMQWVYLYAFGEDESETPGGGTVTATLAVRDGVTTTIAVRDRVTATLTTGGD